MSLDERLPFFYMEGDTIPTQSGWLDALRSEISDKMPFAVLGSRYSGHNWDRYKDVQPPVLPDALLYHLNGNAVYNASHPHVRDVVVAESTAVLENVPQSSFDVRFCEVAMQELGHTEATLEDFGYKQTAIIANFASTLVLPDRVPAAAMLVHGASAVHNWAARFTEGGEAADITLVVSDWGELDVLGDFLTSLATVNGSLPFEGITLVTQDAPTAQAAETAHTEISTATSRNWEMGNAEWDMCTAPVVTTWFMAVSTHFSAAPTFALPTSDNGYKPLVPFKRRDSLYCDCVCKDRVDAAAAITPGYDYDIGAEYAVLHTATRDEYCASLTPQATPSINGYFALVLGNATLANMYKFYDRERYGVIETLEPPVSVESQCSVTAPAAAACVFPFKYRNVTYDNCTIDGTSGAYGTGPETDDGGRAFRASGASLPWCATSLAPDGEADEWKYCRSDIVGYVPGNEGVVTPVRRRRDSTGGVTCTQTGGSFVCSPTTAPTSAPTVTPTASPTSSPTAAPTVPVVEDVSFLLPTTCDTAYLEDIVNQTYDKLLQEGITKSQANVTASCGSVVVTVTILDKNETTRTIVHDTVVRDLMKIVVQNETIIGIIITSSPTRSPTRTPTGAPSLSPSIHVVSTTSTTASPTTAPTAEPSLAPTSFPTPSCPFSPPDPANCRLLVAGTGCTGLVPRVCPAYCNACTDSPTALPTRAPTPLPTGSPTANPTFAPTTPPSSSPTPMMACTSTMTDGARPERCFCSSGCYSCAWNSSTGAPDACFQCENALYLDTYGQCVVSPTSQPTSSVTSTTMSPTVTPTVAPSTVPTTVPTTTSPTPHPSFSPSALPTTPPSAMPTSKAPTRSPTGTPSAQPTTRSPTVAPTLPPTPSPTAPPTTLAPTTQTTVASSVLPTTMRPTDPTSDGDRVSTPPTPATPPLPPPPLLLLPSPPQLLPPPPLPHHHCSPGFHVRAVYICRIMSPHVINRLSARCGVCTHDLD
jgi:hypothetical protein